MRGSGAEAVRTTRCLSHRAGDRDEPVFGHQIRRAELTGSVHTDRLSLLSGCWRWADLFCAVYVLLALLGPAGSFLPRTQFMT